MVSERQRIEASPSPAADSQPPPPAPYEEPNGMFPPQSFEGSADSGDYFLGEVVPGAPLFPLILLRIIHGVINY